MNTWMAFRNREIGPQVSSLANAVLVFSVALHHCCVRVLSLVTIFSKRSRKNTGYATLASKPGPPQSWEASPGVHGVLHAVSSEDLEKIGAYETGYRKRLVRCDASIVSWFAALNCFGLDTSKIM